MVRVQLSKISDFRLDKVKIPQGGWDKRLAVIHPTPRKNSIPIVLL